MRKLLQVMCTGACALAVSTSASAQAWSMLGGGAQHTGLTPLSLPMLDAGSLVTFDDTGAPTLFSAQSSPVAAGGRVFVLGKSRGLDRVYAIGLDAVCKWSAPVGTRQLDSWSSPATDGARVYVASGEDVCAFDALTGAPLWTSPLERPVVNASPVIRETPASGRLFITDFDGFGPSASLYCINTHPKTAGNPYEPGERVWSIGIGSSSGNTPAIAGDLVVVSTASAELLAFEADAGSPQLAWSAPLPLGQASFAGVSIASGAVYAATYAFSGGHNNSRLCKFDAATGSLIWSVPCARTSSIPVPLLDGRILLCAGISGFGTAPTMQMFKDNGAGAVLLWDTAIDTWVDANTNGALDPGEYLALGSWTNHPVVSTSALHGLVGQPDTSLGSFVPYVGLALVDLLKTPSQAGFVIDTGSGGASTAIVDGRPMSIGSAGLSMYPLSCYPDCDNSGALDFFDFLCFQNEFQAGNTYADCDMSGGLDFFDFLCYQNEFHAGCP